MLGLVVLVLFGNAPEIELEATVFIDIVERDAEDVGDGMLTGVSCMSDVAGILEMVEVVKKDVFVVAVAIGVDTDVVEDLRQVAMTPVVTTKSCSALSPALSERTTRTCRPEATLRGYQSTNAVWRSEVELNKLELTNICN